MSRRKFLKHFSALAVTALGLPLTVASHADSVRLLVVGDSLSAEYGLARGSGWVALLEQRLVKHIPGARLMNASVSGETTSGGVSRLPQLLSQHHPSHLILELGGNDALRGLPLAMTQRNLREMVRNAKVAKATVLVVGMQIPPNYGRSYGERFADLFARVAEDEGAALVPFLLKGLTNTPHAEQFFQRDRIHPNEQAQPVMLDNVWATLKPLLR